jgi:tetratricopeptide (TPR) repeat protein
VIALFAVLIAPDVSYARTFLNGSVDPSAALDAAIPNGACLTFDQPGSAINANRFTPSGSDCPAVVDPFGMWIVRNNGNLPGSSETIAPAFVADWQRWLSHSDFVLLAVPLSDYIPFTPALTQSFDQNFTLVYSSADTYLYRNSNAQAPTISSASTASQLVAAGLAAEAAGHNSQALADYREAATKNPHSVYAPYDIAHLDQVLGQSSKAADEYRIALRIDPKYFDALYNMGVLEAHTDPKAAALYYFSALGVAPDNPAANFNLGVLLIRLGKVTSGDSYVETGIRLEPSLAGDLPKGISVPSTTTPAG